MEEILGVFIQESRELLATMEGDLLEMEPIHGVDFIQGDFREEAVAEALVAAGLREGYELVEIGSHAGGDPSQFAGGRLMTYALRQAVLAGRCDLSVHMPRTCRQPRWRG